MRVRAVAVLLLLGACAGSYEALSIARYGVPSPARGLLFVVAAIVVGRGLARAARTTKTTPHAAEAFVMGAFGFATLFGVLSYVRRVEWFAPLAWLATAGSFWALRPIRTLRRFATVRWRVRDVTIALVVLALSLRAAYYTDRLVLSRPQPQAFAWIDTPLWLDVAYGVERSVPPAELLYAGGKLSYHFGAGLVIASVRAMCGVSMQCAYFVVLSAFIVALLALAALCSAVFLRTPRAAWALPAFSALASLEYFGKNLPSVVGLPVLLWLLRELARLRSWRVLPLIWSATLFLALTKEVELVMLAVLGGVIALRQLLVVRNWRVGVALGVSLATTRPLYERLVRVDFKAHLAFFRERLEFEWVAAEVARQSVWLALGVAAIAVSATRPRHGGARLSVQATSLIAAFAAYAGGLALACFVRPVLVPSLDPLTTEWIFKDMWQFELHGRILLVAATALTFAGYAIRGARDSAARHVLALALTVTGGGYTTFNTWRCQPLTYLNPRPEERDDDPVAPLLARVPVHGSVVAADQLNWNDENPHWAAFFGHQFFLLRRGRWVAAYGDLGVRTALQAELFSTADEAHAQALVAQAGITHIIERRERPVPWLQHITPMAENAVYRLFAFRAP